MPMGQHPNVVAIHEVGEVEGRHYFSMDYVEGKSLAEIVRRTPLPSERAARYVKTIAEAVQYAHEKGILHRDLKPHNVLIDLNDQPRITDFGLARSIQVESDLTVSGAVLGTPSYMPPEQAAGRRRELGAASDVYSLGATLYDLLTGRPPFRAETPVDTLRQALDAEPASPRLLNRKIPRDLETIWTRVLRDVQTPGSGFRLTDFVLLLLEFDGEGFFLADDLLVDLFHRLGIAFGNGFGQLVLEEDVALRDFGGVLRVELGQLLFLGGGHLDGGSVLAQPFHREFICGFHRLSLVGYPLRVRGQSYRRSPSRDNEQLARWCGCGASRCWCPPSRFGLRRGKPPGARASARLAMRRCPRRSGRPQPSEGVWPATAGAPVSIAGKPSRLTAQEILQRLAPYGQ